MTTTENKHVQKTLNAQILTQDSVSAAKPDASLFPAADKDCGFQSDCSDFHRSTDAFRASFEDDWAKNLLSGPLKRRVKLRALLGDKAKAYEDYEQEHRYAGNLLLTNRELFRPSRKRTFGKSEDPNGFFLAESLTALLICMISGFLLFASAGALARTNRYEISASMEKRSEQLETEMSPTISQKTENPD